MRKPYSAPCCLLAPLGLAHMAQNRCVTLWPLCLPRSNYRCTQLGRSGRLGHCLPSREQHCCSMRLVVRWENRTHQQRFLHLPGLSAAVILHRDFPVHMGFTKHISSGGYKARPPTTIDNTRSGHAALKYRMPLEILLSRSLTAMSTECDLWPKTDHMALAWLKPLCEPKAASRTGC